VAVVADIDPDDLERIVLSTSFHHRDLVKSIPGSSWSTKKRQWTLPLAWTSCVALRATFGAELTIAEGLQTWAWTEKGVRIDPATKLRELVRLDDGKHEFPYDDVEKLTLGDDVPDTPITQQALILQKELKLFPHQAAGAAFMATAIQCGIFDETGTGKSAQTIAALRILHRLGHSVFPALVIAPNSVKKTWQRELDQWWPGLTVELVGGGMANRRKSLETPAHVYIMNWESLHKHSRLAPYGNVALKRCKECGGLDERISVNVCEVHKRELNFLHFNTVIADEAHRGKAASSKQTRALWSASEGAKYRFGLTGTPIQDTIADFWAILRYISPDEYGSKTRFMDRFAEQGFNMWGVHTVFGIKESSKDEFYAGVNPRMRRMLKKIVLPFLPPIIKETRYIEMLPAQKRAYRQMVKETIAELEGGTLVGLNPLSRATRLLQFASAYAELDTKELADGRIETKVRLAAPSNKINAFMGDVKAGDFDDEQLVIFAQSRQLIDLLAAEMTKAEYKFGMITGGVSTDDRQKNIDEFQAGKTRFMLVTIDAGGVGLTLTAASTMVFIQRAWSSTAMKQAISRAHRIGSERHDKIMVIDYVSENTVEEAQIARLEDKYGRIESIVRDKELLLRLLKDEDIADGEIKPVDDEDSDSDVSEDI
jgi:SNF2 family DNA or RNA helicase